MTPRLSAIGYEAGRDVASARGSTVVQVFKIRMQDGAAARTDGVHIWVNEDLNEVEERCAIEHELEHIRRGHGTCQPEYIEMEVRYAVAMRLLPDLDTVPCEGDDLTAVAKAWGVTRRVLMDRAVTLTKAQAMSAGCFSCLKCPSQAAKMRSAINELVDERPRPQASKELVSTFDAWKVDGPHGAADYNTPPLPRMLRRAVVAA